MRGMSIITSSLPGAGTGGYARLAIPGIGIRIERAPFLANALTVCQAMINLYQAQSQQHNYTTAPKRPPPHPKISCPSCNSCQKNLPHPSPRTGAVPLPLLCCVISAIAWPTRHAKYHASYGGDTHDSALYLHQLPNAHHRARYRRQPTGPLPAMRHAHDRPTRARCRRH